MIAAATVGNVNWFFPAFAVVVGAHFMPSAFIHQMRTYLALGATLVLGGTAIGYVRPVNFAAAGYFGGAVLLICSVVVLVTVGRARRLPPEAARAPPTGQAPST